MKLKFAKMCSALAVIAMLLQIAPFTASAQSSQVVPVSKTLLDTGNGCMVAGVSDEGTGKPDVPFIGFMPEDAKTVVYATGVESNDFFKFHPSPFPLFRFDAYSITDGQHWDICGDGLVDSWKRYFMDYVVPIFVAPISEDKKVVAQITTFCPFDESGNPVQAAIHSMKIYNKRQTDLEISAAFMGQEHIGITHYVEAFVYTGFARGNVNSLSTTYYFDGPDILSTMDDGGGVYGFMAADAESNFAFAAGMLGGAFETYATSEGTANDPYNQFSGSGSFNNVAMQTIGAGFQAPIMSNWINTALSATDPRYGGSKTFKIPPGGFAEFNCFTVLSDSEEKVKETISKLNAKSAGDWLESTMGFWSSFNAQLYDIEIPSEKLMAGLARAPAYVRGLNYFEIPGGTATVVTSHADYPISWLRDSAWQSLSMLYAGHPEETRKHILWAFRDAIPHGIGKHNYMANGELTPEIDYQLDQAIYPIFESYVYWRFTGDDSIFSESGVREGIMAIYDETQVRKHESLELYTSENRPSDDVCQYPYNVADMLMLAGVFDDLSEIMDKVYGDSNFATTLQQKAEGIRQNLKEKCTVELSPFGRIFVYETYLNGNYLTCDMANVPDISTGAWFGGIAYDDPIFMNTTAFIYSKENQYYYNYGEPYAELGDPHATGPWPLGAIAHMMANHTVEEAEHFVKWMETTCTGYFMWTESINAGDGSIRSRPFFAWPGCMYMITMISDVFGVREMDKTVSPCLPDSWQNAKYVPPKGLGVEVNGNTVKIYRDSEFVFQTERGVEVEFTDNGAEIQSDRDFKAGFVENGKAGLSDFDAGKHVIDAGGGGSFIPGFEFAFFIIAGAAAIIVQKKRK